MTTTGVMYVGGLVALGRLYPIAHNRAHIAFTLMQEYAITQPIKWDKRPMIREMQCEARKNTSIIHSPRQYGTSQSIFLYTISPGDQVLSYEAW